jgi:hypothetical protein
VAICHVVIKGRYGCAKSTELRAQLGAVHDLLRRAVLPRLAADRDEPASVMKVVRTRCLSVLLATLAVFSGACATRGETTATFNAHGLSFSYPGSWYVTGFSTTNSPPRLLATSYLVPRDAAEGDCGGYEAVKLLPPDGALIVLIDYGAAPPELWPAKPFPPRPSMLALGAGRLSEYECFGRSTMFRFRLGKRDLQVHVALGRKASEATRERALAVLTGLRVRPTRASPR